MQSTFYPGVSRLSLGAREGNEEEKHLQTLSNVPLGAKLFPIETSVLKEGGK